MAKSLYFPLWPDAYLLDTKHLTMTQHGMYMLLMLNMWRAGGYLPKDEKILARILGMPMDKWRKSSAEVMAMFQVEGEQITQKRLLQEREKSTERVGKRQLAGKAGGLANSLKNKGSGRANATASAGASAGAIEQQTSSKRSTIQYPVSSTQYGTGTGSRTSTVGDDVTAADDTGDKAWPWDDLASGHGETQPETGPDPRPEPAPEPQPKPKAVKDYAIDQGTIRLTYDDLDKWQKLYDAINVAGEVAGMVEWLAGKAREGKNWFQVCQGVLAKKDRERRKEIENLRITAEAQAKHGALKANAPRQMAI